MSNTNILNLPVGVSVSGAEWIPGVQGDTTKRFQASLIGAGPAQSTQSANTLFAGPTSGSAAGPTFRALVLADLPVIPAAGITVGSTVVTGGTTLRVLYDNAGTLGEYSVSGSGNVAMTISPSFTTPTLGAAIATSINGLTLSSSTGVLTIVNGKTLTVSNTLTFTGTDGSTLNVGTGGTLGTAAYQNTGTSGHTLPFLDGSNTWSAVQTHSANIEFTTYATAKIRVPGGTYGDFTAGPTSDGTNIWFGVGTGNYTLTGVENIGVGFICMESMTTGTTNVGMGGGVLSQLTSGSRNVAIGHHAQRFNNTGNDNTAVGENAYEQSGGATAGTWSYNTAIGSGALISTRADYNTGVGYQALRNNTNGTYNVAVGVGVFGTLVETMSGSYNTGIGPAVAGTITTGSFNFAGGGYAGNLLSTGSNNVYLGWQAGYDATTGSGNIYLGSYTTTAVHITTGSNNIFIGNDVYNGISRTASGQLNIGNLILGQAVGTGNSLSAGTIGIGIAASTASVLTLAAGTTAKAPLTLTSGTNLTAAAAGAIEFDGVQFYETIDTSSGRGAVPVEQYVHLASAGSAITTIANFFGTTSNISLVASAYYIIDIEAFFLKTTADTVVWTLTNSAAPTSQNIYYEMSPITGLVAPPGTATMLVGQLYNDATAALAITTGTLTTAVNHYARFKIWLKNGTGTNLKIQATSTSGSVTPGINSYWRARRVSPNNIGTFAA